MTLSLKQSLAAKALAEAMYSFLPGSGAKHWGKNHITFATVAERAAVGDFWTPGGNKTAQIIRLFENTLAHRSRCFEPLIIGIVKEGLRYRSAHGEPITPEEIRTINGHIYDLGFKFPDLWDDSFINALSSDDVSRARNNVATAERERELQSSARQQRARKLDELKTELEVLFVMPNRQEAGRQLEKILNRLFALFQLAPGNPFEVVGEQIDGSFVLDNEVYLLEAKWEAGRLSEQPLLVFRSKVEGKSSATRGVFVAMNGITADAKQAIVTGKQPNFFVMDGNDLMRVLQGALPLDEFLRRRQRLLAERGAVTVLFDNV